MKTPSKPIQFILMVAMAFAQPAFAAKSTILDPYLKVQESLASDQLKPAAASAKKLSSAAKVEAKKASSGQELYSKISKEADKVAGAADIAKARASFKPLSDLMVEWSKKEKPEGVKAMRCTMYPGDWLQKKGETRNPYYGKEMLSCGEPLSESTGQ